jgi:hypothetical protein
MNNSIEHLLQPRRKAIAPYPHSPFKVGDILVKKENSEWYINSNDGFQIHGSLINECFNIFKELEWWEDRTPEEMPQYVKNSEHVFKIGRYDFETNTIYSFGDCPFTLKSFLFRKLPATEEDYNNYQKSK